MVPSSAASSRATSTLTLLPSSPRSLSIDRACRFNSRTSARVWARMSEAFSAPWAARYSDQLLISSSFARLRFSAKWIAPCSW